MTFTLGAILVLTLLAGLLCLAYVIPPPANLNPPHLFETDPFTDEGEHTGTHRMADDPSTRL
jgi:hypothetical protein